MSILRVRNLAQKVLWDYELTGQISDGHWENAYGNDYRTWCGTTCVVDPANVGRDFYAQKDNYNFTAKALLDVVGDRMVEAVRRATGDSTYDDKRMRADLSDLKQVVRTRVSQGTLVPTQPASWTLPECYYGDATGFSSGVVALYSHAATVAHANALLALVSDGVKLEWKQRDWNVYDGLLRLTATEPSVQCASERTYTMDELYTS